MAGARSLRFNAVGVPCGVLGISWLEGLDVVAGEKLGVACHV